MIQENDALSLEYKLLHGYARRNLDISNIVNNPVGLGVTGVLCDSLKSETPYLSWVLEKVLDKRA